MKRVLFFISLIAPLAARNPFFLNKQRQPVGADFVLKSTLIGATSAACIEHQGQSYTVVMGDVVDGCEVIEIRGGFLCLKRKNGTRCTVRLEEERNEG